ncbi:hypothetical protein M2139_001312 [Enterococcus sp. PF1-24]|uniref:hypothetical protein n=1 Tax=unclassified Enterococcus TaxID=2608891 RepID=UPI0024748998|nr:MULTISPECIES: hypothetical protein [unclassified Enterococcus]MDH6364383.1 hypothetical protein [Enterococcus sp. PFB1-1]MDH6401428.1 hypothetical protein [Enterococcus sp. PF1-24]
MEFADTNQPFTKYLLGDNGVVYEAQTQASFSSGFCEADDNGDVNAYYLPNEEIVFQRSADTAAQEELQRILRKYN